MSRFAGGTSEEKKRLYPIDMNAAEHQTATLTQLTDQLLSASVRLADTARRIREASTSTASLLAEARSLTLASSQQGGETEHLTDILRPTGAILAGRIQIVRSAKSLARVFAEYPPTLEGVRDWERDVLNRHGRIAFAVQGYALDPMKNTGTDKLIARLNVVPGTEQHYVPLADLLTLAVYGAKVLEHYGSLGMQEDEEDEDDG